MSRRGASGCDSLKLKAMTAMSPSKSKWYVILLPLACLLHTGEWETPWSLRSQPDYAMCLLLLRAKVTPIEMIGKMCKPVIAFYVLNCIFSVRRRLINPEITCIFNRLSYLKILVVRLRGGTDLFVCVLAGARSFVGERSVRWAASELVSPAVGWRWAVARLWQRVHRCEQWIPGERGSQYRRSAFAQNRGDFTRSGEPGQQLSRLVVRARGSIVSVRRAVELLFATKPIVRRP